MSVPKLEPVSKEEFDAFLAAYPRPLERDVFGAYEPPLVTYNDFALAPQWPESIVAKFVMGDRPGDQPHYGPPSGYAVNRAAVAAAPPAPGGE